MSVRCLFDRSLSIRNTEVEKCMLSDVEHFPEDYDETAPAVGTDMAGHDTFLLGPKVVLLDAFVIDLLEVDTSAQTFKLKMILNLDWDDDGTIEPEVKEKQHLRKPLSGSSGPGGTKTTSTYKTGKYVSRKEYAEDPVSSTWHPEVVLVNAIEDEEPLESGSKLHSVQMIQGRPIISRKVLYQPQCRCEFTYANFPFDETDLVIKFSSNKWSAEQLNFQWSQRLVGPVDGNRRKSMILKKGVDTDAIGGLGQSEFEIIDVRFETVEKDVNSMQRYDNTEGAFSEAHLIIRVRRDPYSYLIRVAFVSELLMILEVLSFLTDRGGLSDRFSISGTIFLAMVSLYGPMADALPKVSVVTRVDKWHLVNFVLLFASNLENLLAFILHHLLNESMALQYTEIFLAGIYLFLVIKNFIWFVEPLSKRDEWEYLVALMEDYIDAAKDKVPFRSAMSRAMSKPLDEEVEVKKKVRDRRLMKKTSNDLSKMMGRESVLSKED